MLVVHFHGGSLERITDVQFAVVSESPVQFALTCTSSGGPATTVTWTRDGTVITHDSNHVLTQTVLNARTAVYDNVLTVTGPESGSYQCIVSNTRGTVTSAVLNANGRRIESVP